MVCKTPRGTIIKPSKSACYRQKAHDEKAMENKFCPQIQDNCRRDCHAFMEAGFNETDCQCTECQGKWKYTSCYCNNPLVTGVILVEQ